MAEQLHPSLTPPSSKQSLTCISAGRSTEQQMGTGLILINTFLLSHSAQSTLIQHATLTHPLPSMTLSAY